MLKRLLTGIVIIILSVGSFALRFVSPYFFDVFVGVIVLFSTFEVSRVYENNKKFNDLYFVLTYSCLSYFLLLICMKNQLSLLALFAILIGLALLIFAVTFVLNLILKNKVNKEMVEVKFVGSQKKYALAKSLKNLFLMIYPAFILSFLFIINHMSSFEYFSKVNENIAFMMLVFIFATTITTDTIAYFVGSALGGKKLCSKISPNKTITGAIGGLVGSVAISLILFTIFSSINSYLAIFNTLKIGILEFAIYGIVASIFSQAGDIFASFIKRKNSVKDYGKIFPGHGGFMDRVDGISFNAVFTFVFLLFLFV